MAIVALHHVTVVASDVERSAAFYERVLGLKRMARPPFKSDGLWYGVGALQIHIMIYPGTFRQRGPNGSDVHFALRTDDFESTVAMLEGRGYSAALADDHPQKLIVKRESIAGFPQVF